MAPASFRMHVYVEFLFIVGHLVRERWERVTFSWLAGSGRLGRLSRSANLNTLKD